MITAPSLIDSYPCVNSLHTSSLHHTQHSLLVQAIPSTPVQLQLGWQFVHQSRTLFRNRSHFSSSQGLSAGGASRQRWGRQQASRMKINALAWDLPCALCRTQQSSSSTPNSSIKKSVPLTNRLPHSRRTSAWRFQNTDFPNLVSGLWRGSSLEQER